MNIKIIRTNTNSLYTEGQLLVNGKQIAHTVEHTHTMLSVGEYQVCLCKHKAQRRIISISHTKWSLGIGQSWIVSQKKHIIGMGQSLIPGAIYQGTLIYERLFDRIEKCQDRKEPIHLIITDDKCQSSKACRHWTKA
ncbi:MAG: hypothetical protein IJZ38_05500 [Bacteroides sp.]|nr:hypothetical protein [Bacteroides sp.]